MADIFTKQQRSRIMSKITGKETKPEILVRKYLFGQGFRFRKNAKGFQENPDIQEVQALKQQNSLHD